MIPPMASRPPRIASQRKGLRAAVKLSSESPLRLWAPLPRGRCGFENVVFRDEVSHERFERVQRVTNSSKLEDAKQLHKPCRSIGTVDSEVLQV